MKSNAKSINKNNTAVASPIEITISFVVLISGLAVMSAAIMPQTLEHKDLQISFDMKSKAIEIAALLKTTGDANWEQSIDQSDIVKNIGLSASPDVKEREVTATMGSRTDVSGPDLKVYELTYESTELEPEAYINISFKVTNLNSKNANGFTYTILVDESVDSTYNYDETVQKDDSINISVDNIQLPDHYENVSIGVEIQPAPSDGDENFDNNKISVDIYLGSPPVTNHPPSTPSKPTSSSETLNRGQTSNFYTSATDQDLNDQVQYQFWWNAQGDPNQFELSEWTTLGASGHSDYKTNSWNTLGSYVVEARAMDKLGKMSGWSQGLTITIVNQNPAFGNPTPTNGATGQSINVDISWSCTDPDGDSLTYDVYFGTANPPTTKVSSGQSGTGYELVTLSYSTTYRWKIVAYDNYGGTSTSSTWSFTTESPPQNSPPSKPTLSGETQCSCGTTYTYNVCSTDPNGNQIYYQFLLGIQEEPTIDGWQGPYNSGVTVPLTRTTSVCRGKCTELPIDLRVIAKDTIGDESSPSDPLPLTIYDTCGGIGPGEIWCFLEETKIIMADGTLKNIEEIQTNDLVKAYDEQTNTIKNDRVTATLHDQPEQMVSDYYLVINNDVKITPEHSIYIKDKWIQANDLKIGDMLYQGKVTSIERIYERKPTYNIELEKYHTYLVNFKNNDILIAHNSYVLGDLEETELIDPDYRTILDEGKIQAFEEIPYNILKTYYSIPEIYDFTITIQNKDYTFLTYGESNENANTVLYSEQVVVYTINGYYVPATMQIQMS